MNDDKMKYIKKEFYFKKVIRTEILFTPLLIGLPLAVGIILIYNWFARGFIEGNPTYNCEIIIGILVIIGNIAFDIPFIKSLKVLSKKK
jgi:hypothetical protein